MEIPVSTWFNINICNDVSNNLIMWAIVKNIPWMFDSQLLIKFDKIGKTFICPDHYICLQEAQGNSERTTDYNI